MKHRLKLFMCLAMLLVLAACTSEEADELVDYHNGYVDHVDSKIAKINTLNNKSINASSFDEAYRIQKNELLPLISEIKDYMDSQQPESDIVNEYHLLRSEQVNTWNKAFQMKFEVLKKMVDQSISEEEANEKLKEADNKFAEAGEKAEKADQKMEDLAEKYDLNLEEGN